MGIFKEFKDSKQKFIIIEQEAERLKQLKESNAIYLEADATKDESRAGQACRPCSFAGSIAIKKRIKIYSGKAGVTIWNQTLQVLGPSEDFYKKNLLLSDKTPDSFLSKYNKPYQHLALPEEDSKEGATWTKI